MATAAELGRRVRCLKTNWVCQVTRNDRPTESDWGHYKFVPTMGSKMEQVRVNLEIVEEAFGDEWPYARILQQMIYAPKGAMR
jgi:hypothetical protein